MSVWGIPRKPSICLMVAVWVGGGLCVGSTTAWGDTILVAVASNFKKTLRTLANRFQQESGHDVVISAGSSGKLFAQIQHGAPFHLFLSADLARPMALQAGGWAVPETLFTYARGRLILWSPEPHRFDGPEPLQRGALRRVALGNPRSVPYGQAAQATLSALGVWDAYTDKMAFGENVGQVLAFVMSGNADAGFVALSQVVDTQGRAMPGSLWEVPQHLYAPLEQGGVLLKQPTGEQAARALMRFLQDSATVTRLTQQGYLPP